LFDNKTIFFLSYRKNFKQKFRSKVPYW